MPQFWVNKGGTWYQVKQLWVNRGGVWHRVKTAFVNRGGVWNNVFAGGAAATGSHLFNGQYGYVELSLNPDGTTNVGADWAAPVGSGASELWVKFTKAAGAASSSIGFGAWAQMASPRVLWLDGEGSYISSSGNYYVSTDGSDATVIGGGTWQLITENA
ncbi:hypothetical protein ACG04Q_11780 [Roseateles sp. DXS20W]|uniref:Uncharacterized protein n=1 Tax=Pelomonas lactea TaxID=3299030 RepID=A0ABW7GJX1_9BURK